MRQDPSDVHAAFLVYETGDESVSVATDIENDQVADQIGRWKGPPNLVEAGKAIVVNEVVPLGEGISRALVFWVRVEELPDRSPRDDPNLSGDRTPPRHACFILPGSLINYASMISWNPEQAEIDPPNLPSSRSLLRLGNIHAFPPKSVAALVFGLPKVKSRFPNFPTDVV